nr:PREDICTED: small serum protein 2-like [Anolis carolinensis]|eukprot:XP_016854252.1 PREDICTED: small serum protein 2-like [Anolis carolinensis]
MKNGKLVAPEGCVDPYNGEKHELGEAWNTIDCLKCECGKEEVECCLRYPAVTSFPGCAVTLDSEKCSYLVHEIGDPSKPCTPEA